MPAMGCTRSSLRAGEAVPFTAIARPSCPGMTAEGVLPLADGLAILPESDRFAVDLAGREGGRS